MAVKALAGTKAKANGGGIVLLPRGQYYLDGPIVVPDGVRFRGESRELVAIHMKEAPKPQDAPTPGYIYSDGGENHAWVAMQRLFLNHHLFVHNTNHL